MSGISIGEALTRGSCELSPVSETAARDVQVVLAEMMDRPREWLLAHPETPVPREINDQLASALQRLTAGEPLPYVVGWCEFFGRRFTVTPDVLIPRPETELLVEKGLQAIDRHPRARTVIDVGTGSGCVGVTVALERGETRVFATDISRPALLVAKENAEWLGAGGLVAFVMADLTEGMWLEDAVVLANLPYVASDEVAALRCEPRLALDGGDCGTDVILRLLQQLARRRPRRATVLLEIGAGQGSAAIDLASTLCHPGSVWLELDLAGRDRILGLEF
ncbi:MAG: peptide chain release factor N(5)-glutamine methyltransferase [Chloroflexi bacterium]|nr:peptide chain release factor N(5)-glutamine methyltransferase [Chloroflexota bacterium]